MFHQSAPYVGFGIVDLLTLAIFLSLPKLNTFVDHRTQGRHLCLRPATKLHSIANAASAFVVEGLHGEYLVTDAGGLCAARLYNSTVWQTLSSPC